MKECVFCNFIDDGRGRKVYENDNTIVIEQYNDKKCGVMLIVPKRHIVTPFELTNDECNSMFECLLEARKVMDRNYSPEGYNIGCNIGKCSGQNTEHAHLHLYPRYTDEVYAGKGVGFIIASKENVRKNYIEGKADL